MSQNPSFWHGISISEVAISSGVANGRAFIWQLPAAPGLRHYESAIIVAPTGTAAYYPLRGSFR